MCVAATAVTKPSSASTIDGTERFVPLTKSPTSASTARGSEQRGQHPRPGGTGEAEHGEEVSPARVAAVGGADRELQSARGGGEHRRTRLGEERDPVAAPQLLDHERREERRRGDERADHPDRTERAGERHRDDADHERGHEHGRTRRDCREQQPGDRGRGPAAGCRRPPRARATAAGCAR